MRNGLALGGFMATGKSTVGKLLADQLGWAFVDVDALLTKRYGPIATQLAAEGEPAFRERERRVIAQLSKRFVGVIATGGGAFVHPVTRSLLRSRYWTVVLSAPLAVLRDRQRGSTRPLWDAKVAERYLSRQVAYVDADWVVNTANHTPEQTAQEVLAWLRTRRSN